MRMTTRKKEILSFEPEHRKWITSEVGAPPLDVSGVAYLLHGTSSFDKTTSWNQPAERLRQW